MRSLFDVSPFLLKQVIRNMFASYNCCSRTMRAFFIVVRRSLRRAKEGRARKNSRSTRELMGNGNYLLEMIVLVFFVACTKDVDMELSWCFLNGIILFD